MRELRPYPEYRDVNADFLAQIPRDWSLRPAVTLARVLTSTVDKHSVDDQVPVQLCNYTDVYYNDVIRASNSYMKATASRDQVAAFSVIRGDVVFTKDSETADDIGIPAYVVDTLPGVVYGYHLTTYRPSDLRYGKFLKWLLDSRYAKATFETRTLGVTRVGLGQNTVRYLRVPTPPPDEASLIGEFLDRETAEIDAFIADQEELIGLLAERRAATISHAVTKGLDPTVPMKDSGVEWIGDVPAHWDIVQLRRLLDEPLKYGANESADSTDPGGIRYLRITDFAINGALRDDTFRSLPIEIAASYMVRPGDVLLARSGATVGKAFLVPDDAPPSCFAGYLIRVSLQRAAMTPAFLFAYTQSLEFGGWRDAVAVSATIPNIGADKYATLGVPTPPLAEQFQIMAFLDSEISKLDAAIADARKAIALSRERRAALISAAVTGKIDVREHGAVA
tara:strand:+ start:33206 stop:34558 length:1353 start_codon:yes stop_codon:yes gene_type:complete